VLLFSHLHIYLPQTWPPVIDATIVRTAAALEEAAAAADVL
jgi:hypothetical protein